MKTYLTAASLALASLRRVTAQDTISVGSCDDWPSTIVTDTVLELTTPEVSCTTNTHVEVANGAAVEITSSEASTKLNNVKFLVSDGSFLCTVPQLDWTSVETVVNRRVYQVAGGAAMRIEKGSTATFAEDVTFSGCDLPDDNLGGGNQGSAIANFGSLTFQGTATFKDTIDGGALYSWRALTFEKDAIFENNKNNGAGEGNGSGGGLYVEFDSVVRFMGSTYFINNEVTEAEDSGGRGAAMYSTTNEQMVFSGPVVIRGNSGMHGAMDLSGDVVFESLVTIEDNVMAPKIHGDSSRAGGILVGYGAKHEFQGGLTATGNSARNGGVLFIREDAQVILSGPVTITGNEARSSGGAFVMQGEKFTLPADADISGNTAAFCPGIQYERGEVAFEGGESFTSASAELCYLGSDSTGSNPEDIVEEFDCETYSESAPVTNGHPYLLLNTQVVKTWDFGTGGGFSCPTQLIVYVTGGQELTVTSSATATTMENVRFEVIGFTKLILDVPYLTMTGIYQSQVGGALFVDVGSAMDVMEDITFQGNSLAIVYDLGLWEIQGGAAVYSAGTTMFYGRADFLGNGQYIADASGYEPSNPDGGALYNSGTMMFTKKGTFLDNFNPNGANGGAIANFGDLTFNLRGIFRNNSVSEAYTDDGLPYGGRGGAVYNGGDDGTIVFNRLAIFKDNTGSLGGCALASRGYVFSEYTDDNAEGDNKVTFLKKAKFKDNACIGEYPTIYDDDLSDFSDVNKGGAAVLAYGATTIEFADTAVFKRNEAAKGGAILNSAFVSFASDAKLFTADNAASETCSDILNNDMGTVQIGTETFEGPTPDLCERSVA